MKNFKKIKSVFLLLLCVVSFSDCKKINYLTDGGVHNVSTPLSTYDYLKGNENHLFDTTILIIDHFNLKNDINSAGTFFAFTNYSVTLLMVSLHVNTLNALYDSLSVGFVKQYMFAAKNINLAEATLASVAVNNLAGNLASSAVKKIPGVYSVNLVNSNPNFNYFTLMYVKVNGVIDGSPNAPSDDLRDVSIACQTTGIITSTGTTLHVLNNLAPLNKL